jgi:hypothetical protein
MTTVNPSAYAYIGNAYGGVSATPTNSSSNSINTPVPAAGATNVTISDAARALLASQYTDQDFSTVTADARAALDDLYKEEGVTVPIADGKPTVDLSGLDRRAIYAIASNSEGLFTTDEQSVAAQELQNRFDAAMGPALSAAKLVGDYSTLYKTALAYFDSMSPEEKADPNWAKQRAALSQGYQAALQDPSTLPQNIPGDPVADFITRNAEAPATDTAAKFGDVATSARAALDKQYASAKANNTILNFDPNRHSGQAVDFSDFDNQSLSAISLNQGSQFSVDESYAAKQELSARTRQSILQAFQQGSSSGDPLAASLGLIQQYQGMTAEQRQAAGISSSFVDLAVSNYKSTSQLMSIFSQMSSGASGSNGGTSLLDYL